MLFCKKNSIFVTRNKQHNDIRNMMTIEEYRAAVLKALLDAKTRTALLPSQPRKQRKPFVALQMTN